MYHYDAYMVAAIALCIPVIFLIQAISSIFSTGGASLISRLLGEDNLKGASRAGAISFWTAFTVVVITAIVGYIYEVLKIGIPASLGMILMSFASALALIILSNVWGVNGFMWAMPIADIFTGLLAVLLYIFFTRQFKKRINTEHQVVL